MTGYGRVRAAEKRPRQTPANGRGFSFIGGTWRPFQWKCRFYVGEGRYARVAGIPWPRSGAPGDLSNNLSQNCDEKIPEMAGQNFFRLEKITIKNFSGKTIAMKIFSNAIVRTAKNFHARGRAPVPAPAGAGVRASGGFAERGRWGGQWRGGR